MREIKFRAWDLDNNRWVYHQLLSNAYFTPKVYRSTFSEWQQYTGLKDKNGKEIYEFDILRTLLFSEWDEQVPRNEIAVVEYSGDRFWAKSKMTQDWHEISDFDWHEISDFDWEVIGNIYENPDKL